MKQDLTDIVNELFGKDSINQQAMETFSASNAAYAQNIDIKENFYYALMTFLYNKILNEKNVKLKSIKPIHIEKLKSGGAFIIKLGINNTDLCIPFFSTENIPTFNIGEAIFIALEEYFFQGHDGCFACIYNLSSGCDYCTIKKVMELLPNQYKIKNNIKQLVEIFGKDMFSKIKTFICFNQNFNMNNKTTPLVVPNIKNLEEINQDNVTAEFIQTVSKLNVEIINFVKDICSQMIIAYEEKPNDEIFNKIKNKDRIIPTLGYVTNNMIRLNAFISKINSGDRIDYADAFECAVMRFLQEPKKLWEEND